MKALLGEGEWLSLGLGGGALCVEVGWFGVPWCSLPSGRGKTLLGAFLCECGAFWVVLGLGCDDDGAGSDVSARSACGSLGSAGVEVCPDIDCQSFLVHPGGMAQALHAGV